MNKKLIASKEERAKMDETDRKQQDAIESLSHRVESLVWVVLLLSVIWGSALIFALYDK